MPGYRDREQANSVFISVARHPSSSFTAAIPRTAMASLYYGPGFISPTAYLDDRKSTDNRRMTLEEFFIPAMDRIAMQGKYPVDAARRLHGLFLKLFRDEFNILPAHRDQIIVPR